MSRFTQEWDQRLLKVGHRADLALFDPDDFRDQATYADPHQYPSGIQLPIMDGYTAVSRIKADPALRSIPIIAVTSYALNGEERKARAAGCDDYVPKPFSPRQLLAKIRKYLS